MPCSAAPEELVFGRVVVRAGARQLSIDGQPAKLGARAFELLLTLIERRDRTVGKNELLDLVWPGLVVEENNLQVHISALRKLLGPAAIATIPGRGYRFTLTQDGVAAAPIHAPAGDVEPAAAAPRPPTNLPAQPGPLIGRDRDIEALVELVQAHALVSIVGAGGIGKTRLAQAVAWRLQDRFADGVWLVELASVADPGLLAAAVAQALGAVLPGRKAATDELVDALRARVLLLVLDNCEHLVEAASRLAQALLEHAPRVHLLVTSQELLRAPGEHLHRTAPLAVPAEGTLAAAAGAAAVVLFVERAVALLPGFALTEQNAADVADICRRLDGLPLVIELAAARVPLLGVAGVRQSLHERLRVLSGGARTGLRRHQALRDLLDWSHGLLGERDRTVFRRAAVFTGSFNLPAAQRTLADDTLDEWDVLDHLGNLVDKSLLAVQGGEPSRYRLLESARAYALERLHEAGETDVVRRRHAGAMRSLFERETEQLWTEPSQLRRRRCLPDVDNLRAALDWAQEAGERELQVALAGACAWLWRWADLPIEGLRRCDQALAAVDATTPPAMEARLLLARHQLAFPRYARAERGGIERAIVIFRQLGDRKSLYQALERLALVCALNGEIDAAAQAVAQMQELHDDAWPPALRWQLLRARVWLLFYSDRLPQGLALCGDALRLAEASGDETLVQTTLVFLEQGAQAEGRTQDAVARGRHLLELTRDSPFSDQRSTVIGNLATALTDLGEVDEALPLAREAAARDARAGMLWGRLDALALLAFKRGRMADAARALGRAEAAHALRKGRRELAEQRIRDQLEALLREALPADDLQRLLAEGAALSDEQAARIALGD
jgi:predicted ATPase/DNA-binding winged helix-turn-helix (wHTH) protein